MVNLKKIKDVLSDSHMEFFYLIFMYGMTVQSTVVTQLIEDKICLNEYGFKLEDCLDAHSENMTLILKETSIITSYRSILSKLPSIATTLFVGAWVNNYPTHLKFIITMPCISSIVQIFILIGNVIFFKLDPKTILVVDLLPWIFGTMRNTFMALQTYIFLTSPPEKRIIKFASIDVASLTGSIAGQYTGGWILDQKPWFPNQLHNYLGVFIISLIFKFIALLFFVIKVPSVYKLNTMRMKRDPDHIKHNLPYQKEEKKEGEEQVGPVREFITKVFSLGAIKKLIGSLFKERPGGRRDVLLLFVFAELVLHIEMSLKGNISFQFSQKAYGWTNYDYSRYHAIIRVLPAFIQLFGPRLFVQKLGVSDINLGLIAIVSHACEQIITGTWLAFGGFITATLAGTLFTLFNAAVRSLLCNVVERDEVGGIFSMISVFSSLLTMVTDWTLIRVFNATLSVYPGLCYHLCACCAIVPFSVFFWIKVKRPHLVSKNFVGSSKPKQPEPVKTNANGNETVLAEKPVANDGTNETNEKQNPVTKF